MKKWCKKGSSKMRKMKKNLIRQRIESEKKKKKFKKKKEKMLEKINSLIRYYKIHKK